MAERLNMAEATAQTEAPPQIYIADASGRETGRVPVGATPEAPRPPSQFENIINAIDYWERQPQSLSRDAALESARRERDRLLEEANEIGLLASPKAELSGLYYSSRVKVTNLEKEGKDEYQGRGKLQELRSKRQEFGSWEANRDFWSSPRVREIEQRLGLDRGGLERKYRGIVADFNQQSIDLIYEVVRDRKRYTSASDPYPERARKIVDLWDGPVVDPGGHVLKQDGTDVIAQNFDDVRAVIEEARRWEPWVPNRADFETYIRFVADDIEELEEMIPYIVARVRRKLGTGLPNELSNKLVQEKEKVHNALAAFPIELIPSEAQFRRLKSTLADNLDLMGSYYFSDKVQDDWEPYLAYTNLLAIACEDTELQDHLVDALLLDKDGLTLLALRKLCEKDGIFWRYGQNRADISKRIDDMSQLGRWQDERREEIASFLMSRTLKKMSVLLGLEPDRNGNTTLHPAFQRLRDQLTALEWQEYCGKALEWPSKFGDPRENPQVIFQHPLARAFKPPTRNARGQIEDEFLDMFEDDDQVRTDKWYASTKRRKVKSILDNAERIARAFMIDSSSALAWHVFQNQAEVNEVNEYLQAAGMDTITINEAVAQKTLYRALMHALIREDKTKLPKDRQFKFYDLLTELLGVDLDIPTSSAWYLGWHDTNRPSVTLRAIEADTRRGSLKEAMPAPGMDEKNTGAGWAERERRLGLLVLMILKGKFGTSGRYFNFPGHDTKGAGVKDIRNWLNLTFGTSRDTVWLNDLLVGAIPTVREWPAEYGCARDPFVQLVGLHKGGNEATFARSGYMGLIENPRDTKSWVKRASISVEQSKAITSGDKEGYALLKDGPFTSMFLWRDFDLSNIEGGYIQQHNQLYAIEHAAEAIKDMKESTYRAGIELALKTAGPLIKVMKQTVDSTVSANPGTARFARTLLWLAVSKWMDTSWEYRQKPGYAVDGNLHVARYFIHTALLEYGDNGLIYNDREFDEIMLGYVRRADGTRSVRYEVKIDGNKQIAKDENGNWVVEKVRDQNGVWVVQQVMVGGKLVDVVEEGLIDAFPKKLRDEILNGTEMEIKDSQGRVVHRTKNYLLPFGIYSQFPETFANYYRDTDAVKRDYQNALSQVTPRRQVTRP